LYEVRVLTSHGARLTSEHIQFRQGQMIEVHMPKSVMDVPPPGGPISAVRLGHKPGKAARKLFREASSLAAKGNLTESAVRIEQAVAADPNWFEAWNNLGGRRLALSQFSEAAEAFRHALSIDPNNATVHSNLGLAQLFLRQPLEAEESARRALKLDPGAPRASYVAGMALLQQNKRIDEALEALGQSSKAVPRALLAMAEWQCRNQNPGACETELKTFLKTPRGPNHEAAETWLKRVKQHRKEHRE